MQLPKAAWIEKQVINRRVNVGEAEHEHHLALLINEEHHERRLKQPHHEEEDQCRIQPLAGLTQVY